MQAKRISSAYSAQPSASWWERNQRKVAPYLFILPFFVAYSIFFIYPVVSSFVLSFNKQIGLSTPTFIGLENYTKLLEDPRYLAALRNTTVYTMASVFILSPLALLVAVSVRSFVVPWDNMRSFYRIAFFLPQLTSFVVVALMFALVYDKDYGLLNAFLKLIGLNPVPWLRDERFSMLSLVIVAIWAFIGINSLYFLAGLQAIPDEINEAAAIDGANRSQTFFFVTLPLLRPTILFVIIQAIIFSYQFFDIPALLTAGGPSDSTLTLALYMYQIGFSEFKLGYASAIGYSIAIIAVTVSLVQLILFRTFRDN
jgi:ABC-type sugar transport system permease subunit